MQPFDAIASHYDRSFTETATGRFQRALVRERTESLDLPSDAAVLELNCGTGTDAVWLAGWLASVVATDISEGMLAVAQTTIHQHGVAQRIRVIQADAGQLAQDLDAAGLSQARFQFVFSNFGGLNCLSPAALAQLNRDASALLPVGGHMVLVMLGRFCWWETLYFLLKGRFKAAFRRWSAQPIAAPLDAHTTVDTWYYSPTEMRGIFTHFKVVRTEAIGFWLPPSYLDPLMQRFPSLLPLLNRAEQYCRGSAFAFASDHYWIVLERK